MHFGPDELFSPNGKDLRLVKASNESLKETKRGIDPKAARRDYACTNI